MAVSRGTQAESGSYTDADDSVIAPSRVWHPRRADATKGK